MHNALFKIINLVQEKCFTPLSTGTDTRSDRDTVKILILNSNFRTKYVCFDLCPTKKKEKDFIQKPYYFGLIIFLSCL